ncbi:protein of unknown function [Candidatus Nitrosocosmicus franklandus]|uniref:Uncharacterized protein n=1 Tax=Candidatus Nitrosocosmicus franklandianus TaxID=1798806 RepID=A0A484ICG7_9ARCH|nr:protein of unknown function [Candidatus Nitrosocosmicus franklandus]
MLSFFEEGLAKTLGFRDKNITYNSMNRMEEIGFEPVSCIHELVF